MGVYFAIRKRNWKKLVLERSKRILLPFIFGMIAIDFIVRGAFWGFWNNKMWSLGGDFDHNFMPKGGEFYLYKLSAAPCSK